MEKNYAGSSESSSSSTAFAQIDLLQWLTSAWSTITDLWLKNPQAIIAIIALAVSLSAVYFQRRTVNTQENNSIKGSL